MAVRKPLTIEFEFRNKRFTDASAGLRAFSKEVAEDFRRVTPVLKREMLAYLRLVALAMQKLHSGAWPAGTTDRTLSTRSGTALKSIMESIVVTGDTYDDLQGGIGGVFYLRTHEFGATIRPKKAKYLVIPLPEALDSRGVPIHDNPRDWDRTFIATSKKGNLIIFRRDGKSIVPLYVLKKSVTIKPRLNMGFVLKTQMPYFVDKAVSAMLKEMKQ